MFKSALPKLYAVLIIVIVSGGILIGRYQISNAIAGNTPNESTLSPLSSFVLVPTKSPPHEASSIDGTLTLRMKTESGHDQTTTYSFVIVGRDGNDERTIFTRSVAKDGTMTIPHNSWSPDGKYVFVENTEGGVLNYFVVKATGENFADNQAYLDVGTLLAERKTGYTLRDATGWADKTLLIVRTMANPSEKGPSYWFDVSSHAFLQLRS